MTTTDQKAKRVTASTKRIDALKAKRNDLSEKLGKVNVELATEQAQLEWLQGMPVSDAPAEDEGHTGGFEGTADEVEGGEEDNAPVSPAQALSALDEFKQSEPRLA